MKTVVLVIAAQEFRDEEYQVPKDILIKAGFKVQTASTTTTQVKGKLGLMVKPDLLLADVSIADLDALVFIGGGGSAQYFEDSLAHSLAKATLDEQKILGAICIAPVILSNAGLLKGRTATVFPDGAETLIKNGANYTGNPVEVDGNIITGNGPEAAYEFGKHLVELLTN